jgi:tetratricopeptide (TPR) repeat protein/lysophospholipase L1-like esterase
VKKARKKHHRPRPPVPVLTAGKKRLFTLMLVVLPFLTFLLIEIFLRIFSYGGRQELFISAPEPFSQLLMINPNIARRYFSGKRFIPTPSNDTFLKQKPAHCKRIFVLGGSTAAGYPYERNLRFSRILESSLQTSYTDDLIEVVNLSMSAINSYTLLDFMDELLAQQPDAILIYAGHNEYYGALGVSSRESFGRRRGWVLTALKLRKLRFFLAIRDLTALVRHAGSGLPPADATLMERIVGDQQIPMDGPLYRAGLEQFEKNLRAILEKAKRRQVPVILSELVSNVRDMPPFISLPGPESADQVFQQARQSEVQGDVECAKLLYLRAKDLDALRFRAPEAFNVVIHQLAQEFRLPVVPMVSRFEAASLNGLIGDQLMVDHLHPNIDGYFIMADAFEKALLQTRIFSSEGSAAEHQPPSLDKHSWGYTPLDSLFGALSIHVLKAGWPFTQNSSSLHALDSFVPQNIVEEEALKAVKYDNYPLKTAHETLAAHYEQTGELNKALAEYRALIAFKPLSLVPYLKAAELLNRRQEFEQVPALLLPVLHFENAGYAQILLGQAYFGLRQYDQAIDHFKQAQQQLGDDQVITRGVALAQQKKDEEAGHPQAAGESMSLVSNVVPVSPQVAKMMEQAQQLLREKAYDQALAILLRVIEIDQVPLAHLWIGQIYLENRNLTGAIEHLQLARSGLPNHPYLLYNLSLAYTQSGSYRLAQETLDALLRVQPNFGDPYNLRETVAAALREKNSGK